MDVQLFPAPGVRRQAFHGFTGIICLGVLAGLQSLSLAQDTYIGVEAGVGFLRVPESKFFGSRGDAAPFVKLGDLDTDSGETAGLTLGGRVGQYIPMALFGSHKSRVELSGFYINGEDSTQATFTDAGPGQAFGWVPISVTPAFLTANGQSLTTSIDRTNDYGGYDIALKLDYRVVDTEIYTPYVGFSAQYLYQDLASTGTIGPRFVNMQESLDTDYYGIKVGMGYRLQLNENWSFLADGSAAFYNVGTEFTVHYEDSDTRVVDQKLRIFDDAIGANARLDLQRQLTQYSMISVYTAFNFLSYAPQMTYGAVGAGTPPTGFPVFSDSELYALTIGLQYTLIF